ncbi:VIR protein [Plasmodium vivax]|uniref:VIR protein n=1 Tax=Plasmodium vivax TaxID=5855 RepID=A0A1G4E646_PLAVI|nr:VIR protein [Plasmodium vivax]
MDSGKLNIKHIPFKVFYDKSIVGKNNKLPSEKRNIEIIKGITFGEFLIHIKDNDKSKIKAWLNQHENKLKNHLSIMQDKLKQQERDIYCKNLNYILDFVVQAIDNLNVFEFARLTHDFQEKSRDVLKIYTELNCFRNYNNSDDKNIYITKIMYDLFEDIQYMLSDEKILSSKPCSKMVGRIKDRWKILIDIYNVVTDRKNFYSDEKCTFPIINQMIHTLKCKKTPKGAKTVTVAELQPLNEIPGSQRDSSESRGTEDVEDAKDVENAESVDPFPDDLTFSLPVNEDPPKLDTTYAAASLAGISLFGIILYKYTPFGSLLNPRRGARIRGNVFPLGNNVYDASIMNNFEYLQTGIQDGQYQVGYGSVTDY